MLPRIGFAGSDGLAAAVLAGLPSRPDWVLTRPPSRKGRGLRMAETPVARAAGEAGIDALTLDPREVDPPEADLLLVVSYGRILPASWLEFPLGAVNFHPSDLPAWRGAAPVERAVMAGATEIGACWIRMGPEMDAGPVLARGTLEVGPRETGGEVRARAADLAVSSLESLWDGLLTGRTAGVCQSGTPTLAPRLASADRTADPAEPAARLHDLVRALDPAPGARARWGEGWLGLFLSRGTEAEGPPMGAAAADGDDLLIGTADGALRVGEVVPAGRGRMAGADFARGWPDARLG